MTKFNDRLHPPDATERADFAKTEAKFGREDVFNLFLPKARDIGEWGKAEFKNGMADIWQALIAEGWTGQSRVMLGEDPLHRWSSEDRHAENPLLERSQGSDLHWTRPREEQAQELDFDR